jgi:hypothetical protein
MLRRLLLFTALLVAGSDPSAAQSPAKMYAIGAVVEKPPGFTRNIICADYRIVLSEEVEYPVGNFQEHRRQFQADFRSQFRGSNHEDPAADLVRHDQVLLVYSFTRHLAGWNCSRTVIRWIIADTFAAAQDELERNQRECSNCSDWREMRRWSGSTEGRQTVPATGAAPVLQLERSMEQQRLTHINRNYDGLEFTLSAGTTARGTSVSILRATNTRTDKAFVFSVMPRGQSPLDPVVLQPGQSFSGPVGGAQEFGVTYELVDPAEARSVDLIKLLRYTIREWLPAPPPGPRPGALGERG